MTSQLNEVSLSEVLKERHELPDSADIAFGNIRIVEKIAFKSGKLDFRLDGATKTKMILVRPGDLVVSGINAQKGAIALYDANEDSPAAATIHYAAYEVNPRVALPIYLWWLLRSAFFKGRLAESLPGGIKTELKAKRLLPIRIPLPSLSEQGRIVAKVEELAAKIEEARGVRTKGIEESCFAVSTETSRIFASLTGFPKMRLGELGVGGSNPIQTGPFGAQLHKSEFVEAGIPVLNVGNVDPNGLILSPLDHVLPEKAAQLSRYSLRTDDLLFARSGATLGKVCLVPSQCDGWLMTGHLFRVRLDDVRCLPPFAFIALRGARSVRDQVFAQVRGATRPGFNTTLLSNVTLPIPPLVDQRRIVIYLDDMQAKVDGLKALQVKTQAELDALLPSILDKAFKGEL